MRESLTQIPEPRTNLLLSHRYLRSPRVLCQEDGKPLTRKVVQGMIRKAYRNRTGIALVIDTDPLAAWLERPNGWRDAGAAARSALLLRKFLGKIQLKPTKGDIGRPYYVAKSTLKDLVLLEEL